MQKLSPGIQMTEIHGTNYGTVPESSPVYAFNTDSARGLALAVDLLDKGVNVYRSTAGFTAGSKQFYSGAALVDGNSLATSGVSLSTLAVKRQTPVIGLNSYPAPRRQLTKPKIGLYTNSPQIPTNPLFMSGPNVRGTSGHCALAGGPNSESGTAFCEALHSLAVKLGVPLSTLIPVTSADLTAGKLVSGGFTAFINPGSAIATTTTAGTPPVTTINATGEALRAFINGGGTYVGTNANGVSAARTVGATTLNTTSIAGLITPGSTFDGSFDTTNPVAWGFDLGGWIYRDSTGNPVFDGNTLGAGSSVVTYGATPDEKYGYEVNAAGLVARPAVVDVPYGSGHSVLLGFNPFYRSWKESDERLVLNAALYPKGAQIGSPAPSAASAAPAPEAGEIAPVAAPIAAAKLPEAARAPVKAGSKADRDVRITVKRADGAKLKAAVKSANLSKSLKRKLSYTTTKTSVTLVIKGVRTGDEHARKTWVSRITKGLDRRKVNPLGALV
jgi:hypothetical protein